MNLNFLRVSAIIISFILSCAAILALYYILIPRIDLVEFALISLLYLSIWVFSEIGLFAIGALIHDRNSAIMQKELDVERAFRKLSKKWEQPE